MDQVVKALVGGGEISLTVIKNRDMVQKAAVVHLLSDLGMHALGRVLTAVTYMCAHLKDERGKISATFKGDGAGGDLCVAGDYFLHMRGAIDDPYVYLPKKDGEEDVAACIGKKGTLTVVRDDGYEQPFVGVCELSSGDVSEEFTRYFALSEQLPTAFALFVETKDDNCAFSGGVMIQPLPGASEENVTKVGEIFSRPDLKELLKEMDAETFAKEVFGAEELSLQTPLYQCNCSRAYLRDVLMSFGEAELRDMLKKDGRICAHCHFCNTDYVFYEEDVDEMFAQGANEA